MSAERGRAGLSEVIAALLILLVSITLGTMFFTYGTAVLGATQSEFIRETALSRDKVEERVTVASTFYNSTEDSLYVAVFNYGRRTATLATLYVNQTAYEYGSPDLAILGADRVTSLSSNQIQVGSLAWIRVDGLLLEDDEVYTITLATERGNSYELLFRA